MPNFDFKKISSIKGKQSVYQLTIDDEPNYMNAKTEEEKNERKNGVFDTYREHLDDKYRRSLMEILGILERKSNLESLSEGNFKDITPAKENVKEYEFKFQDLRVYAIKIQNGVLILLGGFKNQQHADISRFRSLKKQYLQSLNKQK